MKGIEIYKEAIRSFGPVGCTAREAADKVYELHPEWAADKQDKSKFNNQMQAEIASIFISKGRENFEINRDETPIKIIYVDSDDEECEIEDNDVSQEEGNKKYNRGQIIESALSSMSDGDYARIKGFDAVQSLLKSARLKLHLDHAKSLSESGESAHHPDNFQFLTTADNQEKNAKSCERFTYEEQDKYLRDIAMHKKRIGINIEMEILEVALKFLETIY